MKWDASYDVVVVGSGAAGLTAGLTAKLQGMKSLVIEKQIAMVVLLLFQAVLYGFLIIISLKVQVSQIHMNLHANI